LLKQTNFKRRCVPIDQGIKLFTYQAVSSYWPYF
jgi:hypothetical protein